MKIPSSFQLATASQSKRIDSETILQMEIPGRILMEIAGAKAAAIIQGHEPGARALIFCGKGNNAGDALVVARYLSQNSIFVSVLFAEGTTQLSPDANINFRLLKKLQSNTDLVVYEDLPDLNSLPEHDFIIDGLLGTGIKNTVREPYYSIIDFINKYAKRIYALDLPTGLNADNGRILGKCIKADYTFCLGTQKIGCYLGDGPQVSGEKIFCDLGFPQFLKSDIKRYAIDDSWIANAKLPQKTPRHKYEAGIVYLIAGSGGLTGAAVMAAKSAWAEGLGSVSVITPKGLANIYESHLVHQTKFIVGEKGDTYFKTSHLNEILAHVNRREGTVVIGPGLSGSDETAKLVRQFVLNYQGKIVIDADAIRALSNESSVFLQTGASIIMTPHPGELKSLIKSDLDDNFNRMIAIEKYCKDYQVCILSKGLPNIIATPHEQTFITQYDTSVFARTGFGDILTGKIAALWELTGSPDYSCIKALLDGKARYDSHIENFSSVPEPLDLI